MSQPEQPARVISSEYIRSLINWLALMTWAPWFYIPLSLILLYFPDGHLPSRRWWPVAAAAIIGFISMEVSFAFHPWPWEEWDVITDLNNPFGIPGSEAFFEGITFLYGPLLVIGVFGSLASVVVRFRRSKGVERAQMKWLVYVASLGILTLALFSLFVDEDAPILGAIFDAWPLLMVTFTSSAIALAILRYRLYDIDIIIRRTLVYGLLTGLLALLYFGLVTLLQNLFSYITDQESPVVIVISTLAIAALFTPLRRRIQDLIDRRFYRRKYDAAKELSAFSNAVRDEVELERLAEGLLGVVQRTLLPESVSLWLKERKEE